MKSRMTLRYCGTPDARRYFIQRADGFVWSGLIWSADITDASLWASLEDANQEYNQLQLLAYQRKPVKEFECRLVFRVHGDRAFTLDHLREYLRRSLRITLDVEAHGEGPTRDVFVLPVAMVGSLKPVRNVTSEELVSLARQARREFNVAVEAEIARHPTLTISCDAEGKLVTCFVNGDYLTVEGWKTETELGLYDEEGCLREDAEYPQIPVGVFLAVFPDTIWQLV